MSMSSRDGLADEALLCETLFLDVLTRIYNHTINTNAMQ